KPLSARKTRARHDGYSAGGNAKGGLTTLRRFRRPPGGRRPVGRVTSLRDRRRRRRRPFAERRRSHGQCRSRGRGGPVLGAWQWTGRVSSNAGVWLRDVVEHE